MTDALPIALFVYIVILASISFLWASGDIEAHDAIWWPLALFKFLIKTLWKALTTGWR